ncbi:MAG TPA: vanadium-dependent haloperoxidase [Burkholderiaceae bacterium]
MTRMPLIRTTLTALVLSAIALHTRADTITDWNVKVGEVMTEAKLGTPPAMRVMAIVQTAVLDAVNAAAKRPSGRAEAIDAAVAAANRTTMLKLMPAQEASIQAAYSVALAKVADGAAKQAGIAAGEEAAAAVLAARADDGAAAASGERYKPHTAAGVYVPTASVAVPQWPQRKPWLLKSAAQVRPAAQPALGSAIWARDYNEVKALGGKASTRRTPEQTDIARFWEYSLPPIYTGVVRSVALAPGRDVVRNAHLYAAVSQAMDDSMIAVFDAKYTYNFWRPVTAIRNAEIDGNDSTELEAGWAPLVDNPMHPEYPSGHGILAGAIGAVLKADVGSVMPELSTSSPSAKGATRRWTSVDEFVLEVNNARVWGGLHYRFSTEVAAAMGRQIGELAAARHLPQP